MLLEIVESMPVSRHPVENSADFSANVNSYFEMVNPSFVTDSDRCEYMCLQGIKSDLENVKVITWENVKEATRKELGDLYGFILDGSSVEDRDVPVNLREFLLAPADVLVLRS